MDTRSSRRAPLLVSACLLGLKCRYDGKARRILPELLSLAAAARLLPVCPEQLGGLPTPRPAACIEAGGGHEVLLGNARVVDEAGRELGEAFQRGARETLALARLFACETALLKERSTSCGVRELSCRGASRAGRGVTAALLAEASLELLSDEDPSLSERLREWHETHP